VALRERLVNGQTFFYATVVRKSKYSTGTVKLQREFGVVSRSTAQRLYNQLCAEANARILSREHAGLTWLCLLTKFYNSYLMQGPRQDSTTVIDGFNTIKRHTKSWSKISVDQLRPMHVEMLYADLEKQGLSHSRKKALKSNINRLFDWGRRERLIPTHIESPARGVKIPKTEKKKQPILTRTQLLHFLTKAREFEHDYYYTWALAANTGARSGELLALRWMDVDWERKLISITKSYSSRLKKDKDTKTKQWRDFPINESLESLLKELKLKTGSSGYVLPRVSTWLRGEAAKETRDFCVQIGLPEITFHSTRACFAVQCLESGVSISTAMRLGGWTDVKSFQHYVRLAGVEIRGATDNFNLIPEKVTSSAPIPMRLGAPP
jgi:integrase